ncbi:ABC transporter permease [Larkinella terrae]|uniref:FtsX-like permease family protein n=1 Tax=Larkinella terrae TaxID=2025311 RepID=A0A7K0ERS8_9BACT|nr:ABC transporter permease [Larkinella terrae]MRS64246.1 FtsX-like permease family protein [Larkinella terrae]
MLKNYLLTAFRAFRRNWNYSVINVIGLTLSLACCLLLFVVIRYELSFDRHHANADRTYRLVRHFTKPQDGFNVGIPLPVLAAMRNDFPELKHQVTFIHDVRSPLIAAEDVRAKGTMRRFQEANGVAAFAEPEYFRLFDYQWISGSPATALNRPGAVVLSEELAHKYFGEADPMGKKLKINNKLDVLVAGVVKNPPATSSIPFQMLVSFASLKQYGANTNWDDWGSSYSGAQLYLMLPENTSAEAMERKLVPFLHKYVKGEDAKNQLYELDPLTEIHYSTELSNYSERTIGKEMIWAMALIGLFLLITACVNFVNLATAQAIRRSKEVGVRKVLGSSRLQLVRQFLGETGFLTGVAVLLALLIANFSLSSVAELLNIKLQQTLFSDPMVLGFLVLLAVFTTVLAGFYPALVLSGYQPVLALKGKMKGSGSGQLALRRSLIVLQFTISQTLIIGTVIVYNQMDYFRNADLGFRKEAIVMVPIPEKNPGQLESLRAKLTGLPGIGSMSFGISSPSARGNWWTGFRYENREKYEDYSVVMRPADTSYVRTFGLKLIAGRVNLPADTMREAVVNEKFLTKLGLKKPDQILGKLIEVNDRRIPVVGIVKNFNTNSLHQDTEPCIITTHRDAYGNLGIQVTGNSAQVSETMAKVGAAWSETFPEFLFKYDYLDKTIANFYAAEERQYALFRLLAGIAIFIGCLGLYGVVAFMAESRTKEIGIRKALGASTSHIFGLFSLQFLKLVFVALLLAAPIAWYFTDKWLQDFAYKVDIQWWMFALAGVMAGAIALVTVSFQSIKAALMNPVKSLRTE